MMNLKVTTPSEREIRMTRVFDAPRALVWRALTEPDLLKRWLLGPDGWSLEVEAMDLRVGGAYRWVWSQPGVPSMAVSGVYREIVPGRRFVNTERFDEAWYEGEALVTNELTEQGARTLLTMSILYESRTGRDMALKSGMEHGVEASYNRLAEMLASLSTPGVKP